jgi:chromosome partitioning protein
MMTADQAQRRVDDDAPLLEASDQDATRSVGSAGTVTAAELAAQAMDQALADTPIAQAAATAVMAEAARRVGLPRPERTRVLVVANQKGGVGKTTSAVNLAAALASCGLHVLVIDLDPQGNASTALGIDHRVDTLNIYDALVDGTPLEQLIKSVEGFETLDCVPATIDLAGAEIELVSMELRESRLRRVLEPYVGDGSEGRAYDFIFIDCPPSLGLLTVNALVGGDEVLIPIQCEYYALEGLSALLRNIELVQAHLNPSLVVSTILLTMFDGRTRLSSQVVDEIRSHFGETALRTMIPRSVRISEAPSYGQTVMTYDPGSSGAMSYLEAAREIALADPRVAATTDVYEGENR